MFTTRGRQVEVAGSRWMLAMGRRWAARIAYLVAIATDRWPGAVTPWSIGCPAMNCGGSYDVVLVLLFDLDLSASNELWWQLWCCGGSTFLHRSKCQRWIVVVPLFFPASSTCIIHILFFNIWIRCLFVRLAQLDFSFQPAKPCIINITNFHPTNSRFKTNSKRRKERTWDMIYCNKDVKLWDGSDYDKTLFLQRCISLPITYSFCLFW